MQGKNLSDFIKKKNFNFGLCLTINKLISFKVGMMIEFDTNLNDLDLHSRSQFHKKTKTCALILWQVSQPVLMKFSIVFMI